jgi:hypothetical protein
MPAGSVKILVAIADVDAVVKIHSGLDEHAKQNTTSVYTAAQIFPVLPEKLSTYLTSLNVEADRLAIVIEMVIGGMVHTGVRTFIKQRCPTDGMESSEEFPPSAQSHARDSRPTAIMEQPHDSRLPLSSSGP